MSFLCGAAAVPDAEAAVPENEGQGEDKAEDSAGKQTDENSQDAGYHQGNAAEPLAFFPDLLVFHTPLCPKAHQGVHADFRHDISQDQKGQSQQKKHNLIDIQSQSVQIFCLGKGSVEEEQVHGVEKRKPEQAADHAGAQIIRSAFFLMGGEPCDQGHEGAKANGNNRKNQGLVLVSPPVDLSAEAVVGRNFLRQMGQGCQGKNQGQQHQKDI